jgi:hypothetical protein
MSTPRRLPRNRPRDLAVLVAAAGDGDVETRADEGVSEPASPEAAPDSPRAQRRDNRTTPDRPAEIQWLDLDAVAEVTIVAGGRRLRRNPPAWTAECSGEQLIEVRFRRPTPVSRLRVTCSEFEQSRTQEMTIWASLHRGERHREVLRQQFNFSPDGATNEVEEYALQLEAVSAIQLRIVPSIDGRPAVAHVKELRLASTSSAE